MEPNKMAASIAEKIWKHPDKEEILGKLLSDVPIKEIEEWLQAKYESVEERQYQLTARMLSDFKKHNLDFYQIMQNDIVQLKEQKQTTGTADLTTLQGNSAYQTALARYVNQELDIKQSVQKLCAAAELRVEQVFNNLQNDPDNLRFDRTLMEWMLALKDILKDYNELINGNPDQINIQNNINIQVLDSHINLVYNVIREILSKLDYDTSLMFIDLFNTEMQKLKDIQPQTLPIEQRLSEAKLLSNQADLLLNTPIKPQ